jgi:uncharacterized protein (DUF2461 family)
MNAPFRIQHLPDWARTDECKALIEQIIAEQPDSFTRFYEGSQVNGLTIYKGKAAGRLRRIHDDWVGAQYAALDAQFEVTGSWDDAAGKAIHAAETADQLIERLIEGLTEVHGDPFLNSRKEAA